MTQNIYNAIRNAIIESHKIDVETEIARETERLNYKLGKEYTDIGKPRITKVIEFINPRTGRKNHKTLKNQWQTYVYTQEMYDRDLAAAIEKANNHFGLSFQVCTDDSVRCYYFNDINNPTDAEIEKIYNDYGEYAEHIVGFNVDTYPYFGKDKVATYEKTSPIFEGEYNDKFWGARDAYIKDKSDWCSKYGCD